MKTFMFASGHKLRRVEISSKKPGVAPLLSKTGSKQNQAEAFSWPFSTFAADLENNPHESEPGTNRPGGAWDISPG
jgi:hypothetical protein